MEGWRKDARHEPIIVDLDALVPKGHLLRKIEKLMDYEWLYERLNPYWAEKIPISLDIPTLLRMSQLDLARTLTESIVKNGYFQDIATGRNAALITGRSSSGLLYLIFA